MDDKVFWKAIYCLLQHIFPALRAICYNNANFSTMKKIFLSTNRVYGVCTKYVERLDNDDFFGSLFKNMTSGWEEEVDKS